MTTHSGRFPRGPETCGPTPARRWGVRPSLPSWPASKTYGRWGICTYTARSWTKRRRRQMTVSVTACTVPLERYLCWQTRYVSALLLTATGEASRLFVTATGRICFLAAINHRTSAILNNSPTADGRSAIGRQYVQDALKRLSKLLKYALHNVHAYKSSCFNAHHICIRKWLSVLPPSHNQRVSMQ